MQQNTYEQIETEVPNTNDLIIFSFLKDMTPFVVITNRLFQLRLG